MTQKKSQNRARAAFIDAFIQLLGSKSFDDITANEIIALSTYSKASFYRYFNDKYDLADQIIHEEALSYIRIIGTQMMEDSELLSPEEFVFNVAIKTFLHVFEKKDLYHIILNSNISGFNLNRFCSLALQYFKSNNQFVPDPTKSDIDTDFYYYCTTHQFLRYICYWDSIHFAKSPEYMALQVAKMTILSKPGAVLKRNLS